MNTIFDYQSEVEAVLSEFHEELYQLEEAYLKLFGVYPTMPNLNKETIGYYVQQIRYCLADNIRIEDLKIPKV